MALLYRAQLTPSKIEVVRAWLDEAPYSVPGAATAEPVAAFRFDDPDGEVGIETHLVRTADETVVQVPLTYRSAPLTGGRLAGELEHSVLGHRWVYDATTDPVYVRALLAAIVDGRTEVDQFVHVDGGDPRPVESTAHARGSGAPDVRVAEFDTADVRTEGTDTLVTAGAHTVVVHHVPLPDAPPAGATLDGTWPDGGGVLATLRG